MIDSTPGPGIPDGPGRSSLERGQLRRLELASVLEGTTLLLLVCVAVPLKHLGGLPMVVHVLGPVHGLAFALYLWTVVETAAGGGWTGGEILRLALAAFVPFGAFGNLGWLRRRSEALGGAGR